MPESSYIEQLEAEKKELVDALSAVIMMAYCSAKDVQGIMAVQKATSTLAKHQPAATERL